MSKPCRVAVCGATGAVGNQMITCLEEASFPFTDLVLLASERSRGKKMMCMGKEYTVQALSDDSFEGVDIALFSAGSSVSKEFAPKAAASGCVVIDNSKTWRMDPAIPLVVPEVNEADIRFYKEKGIIANPNCSTIQLVVALKPIHDLAGIRRVVVSTYQSVSGSGQTGINELRGQLADIHQGREPEPDFYPQIIAGNALPHIGSFLENGYTDEEMKALNETRKIMGDDTINVTCTCVRVPVEYAHSESVNITTTRKVTPDQVRSVLMNAPGVKVVDDPSSLGYPTARMAQGQDLTMVGRIREDISQQNGIDLWVVADNVRKGAATNAVQIARVLLRDHL